MAQSRNFRALAIGGAALLCPVVMPSPALAQAQATAESRHKVDQLAADLAAELARLCPVAKPDDQAAFDACRRALFNDPQVKRALPPYLLWGRQRDPNARIKDTTLTRFAPDVWTGLYLPLFMFNGKYTVEFVDRERLYLVRLEAAFRNRLQPGEFPYPFWHDTEKWTFYENANSLLLWVEPAGARIRVAQYTPNGANAPLFKPDPATTPAFDGKWMWTDANGKLQPQVTLFDGLFSDDNPYKPKVDEAYKKLALKMREGECDTCHVPDNPHPMKRLVLLQTPAHAAGEIKRVLKAIREGKMPLDEFGVEKGLNENLKKALLENGAAFDSLVDAAKGWESTHKQ